MVAPNATHLFQQVLQSWNACSKSFEGGFFKIACTSSRIEFWSAKRRPFNSLFSREEREGLGGLRKKSHGGEVRAVEGWDDEDTISGEMICHKHRDMWTRIVLVQLPPSLVVLRSFFRYVRPL